MWRRCVIAPRYIPPRPPPRAGIVRRTPRHSPCAHAVAGDDHAASCRRNAVRLPFRRRACGLRLVRNRARRAGVGRHRDPARRADPGHARGGRPGHPWAMAFLPDGGILITERPGNLRLLRIPGGLSAPLKGVPKVAAQGQGGLLDVALSPDFAKDRLVYLSYAEAGDGRAGTAVGRAVWPMTGPAWRISASCSGRSPSCPRGCISVPAWCWTARASLHRAGREQPALHRARPGQAAGQGGAHPPTARCRRTIPWARPARAPRSGPMATAIRRAWR